MRVAEIIEQKLTEAFNVTHIDVVDDSARHAGHAGAREGGESHFNLLLVSPDFEGKNKVARQREIYRVLKEEMAGPIHALSMDIRTPDEYQ